MRNYRNAFIADTTSVEAVNRYIEMSFKHAHHRWGNKTPDDAGECKAMLHILRESLSGEEYLKHRDMFMKWQDKIGLGPDPDALRRLRTEHLLFTKFIEDQNKAKEMRERSQLPPKSKKLPY